MNKRSLTRLALSGMVAGGLALTACENSTSSNSEKKTDITAAKTLGEFTTACAEIKGMLATHDCQGKNDCKGHSFQEGKGVASHTCRTNSDCKGASCIEK